MPGKFLLGSLRRDDGIISTVPCSIESDLRANRLPFTDRKDCGYYPVTRPDVQRPTLKRFVAWLHSVP